MLHGAEKYYGYNEFQEFQAHKERALESLNKAIELKPYEVKNYIKKGKVLLDLYRHEEALEVFNESIELDPNNSNAYYSKGITLDKLERHKEALDAYNKAIEFLPSTNSFFAYMIQWHLATECAYMAL